MPVSIADKIATTATSTVNNPATPVDSHEEEYRTWTSATGVRNELAYIDFEEVSRKAVLRMRSGLAIKLALEKLCLEDQEWVLRTHRSRMDVQSMQPNPVKPEQDVCANDMNGSSRSDSVDGTTSGSSSILAKHSPLPLNAPAINAVASSTADPTVALPPDPSPEEFRTFTSATGVRNELAYISFEETSRHAVLRMRSGRVIKLDLSKLCSEDQDWVLRTHASS
jgi:hypothetical protein